MSDPNQNRKNSGRADLWVILGIALVLIVAVVLVLLRLLDQSEKHVETVKDMRVEYSDTNLTPEAQDCEESIERDVNANPDRRETVFEQLNLTEKGMQKIARLKHLVNLNLTGSTLKDDWLKHLEELPLERLNLTATDVTNRGLKVVARIPTLHELVLDELNCVDDQTFEILKPLENLSKLQFKGSKVTAIGIKQLSAFPHLTELRSSNSDANGDFLRELSELRRLKTVNLEQSKISLHGISHLSNSKRLKYMYLDGANIDDQHAAALARVQNLEGLSLVNNALGDPGLAELAKMPNLGYLNVNECRNITNKGIEHFAHAKPNCNISHSFGQEDFNKTIMNDEP